MIAAVTLTNAEIISIGVPAALGVVSWMTYVTKVLWDIRTSTKIKDVEQDQRLHAVEADIRELQDLLPRTVPSP